MRLLCIDGKFSADQLSTLTQWPIEGEEYTLRSEFHAPNGQVGFLLNEVVNPPLPDTGKEPSFRRDRFVPLSNIDELATITEETEITSL